MIAEAPVLFKLPVETQFKPIQRVARLRTGTSYLTAWTRRYRHSVSLSLPESGMAPETLVDHATQHMRRRRRSRRGDQDFDEIWCVFDIDQHPERTDCPTQRTAKWTSRLRSPILAWSSGSCCTPKIRPRISVDATSNGEPANSNLHSERGFPTARGVRCSMSSKPPNSAPKRWTSGTRATVRLPGRTQALTSGSASTGSVTTSRGTPLAPSPALFPSR